MDIAYQLIFIGGPNKLQNDIETVFFQRTAELGLTPGSVAVITASNFDLLYRGNAPAFAIYFGKDTATHLDLAKVDRLQEGAKVVLPVVSDLTQFNRDIPEQLRAINGFELKDNTQIEALVSLALENFGLLRTSRRLFISYKRDESTAVAIQLFERLEKAGFDVFLDTHSIRPGEPFQEELWQRLADTDVVVLLNTPNFLVSHWTQEELAKANTMSIGILQLIWPSHHQERYAELTIAEQLSAEDFGDQQYATPQSYLSPVRLDKIVKSAESLRARSLAARQTNMVSEFSRIAAKLAIPVSIQPGKFMLADLGGDRQLIVIPAIGVPQALTYQQSQELVKSLVINQVTGIFVLYDHLNIRPKSIGHLTWLDGYLKVKSMKLLEAETKLAELKAKNP